MKKNIVLALIAVLSSLLPAKGQVTDSTDIYLLTCGPGSESYSIYGHTALRIVIRGKNFDNVYNWGVFDFSTPNFTYQFAKGKLDYMLGVYRYERFVEEYEYERRSVWSQKINFTPAEKENLFNLINENLQPENIKYRYDFFFDNCATRVRDIIARSAADTVIFPEKGRRETETFRQLIDPYQKALPWLDLGADMLLGLQADRKASVSDEMFLPIYLKDNLSGSVIVHDGRKEPLLGDVQTVIDMPAPRIDWFSTVLPQTVFYILLVAVVLITFVTGTPKIGRVADWILFPVYSLVALLLLFTNFLSEHQALHFNLLILAINPLLPVLTWFAVTGRKARILARLTLTVSLIWIPASLFAGQGINPALIPIALVIMVRTYRLCGFGRAI